MRLLKISSHYPHYLRQFYLRRPGLVNLPYDHQMRAMDDDVCQWANFWGLALSSQGYEVIEVISNADHQKKWAIEKGVKVANPNDWMREIVAHQIVYYKPDIIFMDDYSNFDDVWIRSIRERCRSLRLLFGWCGAPYQNPNVFKEYDFVLSCIPELVEGFRALGHRAFHLHHAFSPLVLSKIQLAKEKDIPLSFLGLIAKGKKMHNKRGELLQQIAAELPLQIFSPVGMKRVDIKLILKQGAFWGAQFLKFFGLKADHFSGNARLQNLFRIENPPESDYVASLAPLVRPGKYGVDFYQTLQRSLVTLNNHIDASPRSASNMRMFEATGVGTCLLTDDKENISELFERDHELVTYRSAEECVEKARWLLDHPQKAIEIGLAGQRRCLRDHGFDRRAARLHDIIKTIL